MLQESSCPDTRCPWRLGGADSRAHPSAALVTHSLPIPTSWHQFLPSDFYALGQFTPPGQTHLGRKPSVQGRHQEVPGHALREVGSGCHCHLIATNTGTEPQPLAFPVHFVSKLVALRLTGCQLFLPGLRKGGIKGFLWPIPRVELMGRGPSPPGLGKCFTDRFLDDS